MKRLALGAIALMLSTATLKAETAYTLVVEAAKRYNVPVEFALRIASHESDISCGKWGDGGMSAGPLQIWYPTANHRYGVLSFKQFRMLSCYVHTDLGMRHLAMCLELADWNERAAARCHNGGPGATWARWRSVNRYATAVLSANAVPTAFGVILIEPVAHTSKKKRRKKRT